MDLFKKTRHSVKETVITRNEDAVLLLHERYTVEEFEEWTYGLAAPIDIEDTPGKNPIGFQQPPS